MTVRFAVAMPVCGQEEFVADALESLRAQSAPLCLALLDATPDDRVQRVAARFPGLVACGYHHGDAGQSAAINAGFAMAEGDVVTWLNADDMLYPDALEAVAAAFEAHPEADVVFGHAVHVDAAGGFLEYFPSISTDPAGLRRGDCIAQPSCFYRRRLLERVGAVREDLHYAMDWDLWCRFLDAGARFHFLDRPLAAMRIHQSAKTSSLAPRRYREILDIARRYNPPPAALAMVASFLAYDLRGHPGGRLPAALLDGGRAVLRRLAGRPPVPPPPNLFGLAAGTGMVDGACRLWFPWFGGETRRLRLTVDRPGEYRDGDGRPAIPVGRAGAAWTYDLPCAATAGVIDVTAAAERRWRLLGARPVRSG
jgi:GT2 family glycosyltransferase